MLYKRGFRHRIESIGVLIYYSRSSTAYVTGVFSTYEVWNEDHFVKFVPIILPIDVLPHYNRGDHSLPGKKKKHSEQKHHKKYRHDDTVGRFARVGYRHHDVIGGRGASDATTVVILKEETNKMITNLTVGMSVKILWST